jgi:tetratricopeptide (TPR) repeat protein
LYAQIALELGKINYEQYRDFDAREFYDKVVETQIGKEWYPAGRLGQAECMAMQQRYENSLVLYREVVEMLLGQPLNRALDLAQVQESLVILAQRLGLEKQYDLALSFLELEQEIAPTNDVEAAFRFARMHAYMAGQLEEEVTQAVEDAQSVEPTEKEALWMEQRQQVIKTHYEQAAENFLRVARYAIDSDSLYGDSLWQAALNYDKSGNVDQSIIIWRRFIEERENQPRWPYACFHLAQVYQSIGSYDLAIEFYQLIREKHPRSGAAFDGMVPLARCFLSKEPQEPDKAEALLRIVLEDPAVMPFSKPFRQAMFELGMFYYARERFDEAISILGEAIERYSDDERLGKVMFLVGDSFRRSGLMLDSRLDELRKDPTLAVSHEQTSDLRRQYLEHAKEYFDLGIEFFERKPEGRRSPVDQLHLRQCYLYRAACMFDLGRYREASQYYELAALRYQLTPTALQAFVQIVNCQLMLGNESQARSANERAYWQLRKMSDDILVADAIGFSRQQWEDWFEWTGQSGLW